MIQFHAIDVPKPMFDPDKVRGWIASVIRGRGFLVGELHYYFCSDEALLEINRQRLGHDFYTDIVTFPLSDDDRFISSEFCISLDRIAENALTFGRTLESELFRVMIHGVLHLIGFDDHTPTDQAAMRAMEEKCLSMILNN
ncbi:MAG: rRNA maturation RNase YbeY [Bacteroidales bacterium]|nr:rRNA maturation RNase YbeY [Bacteroidales bacterium]